LERREEEREWVVAAVGRNREAEATGERRLGLGCRGVTPGFRRQTECEPCTCQDQLFTYTAVT
jgi:hypothetical protein